jgi:curved DNA-binding protein CbpA
MSMESAFVHLSEAYDVLSDKQKRAVHDEQLAECIGLEATPRRRHPQGFNPNWYEFVSLENERPRHLQQQQQQRLAERALRVGDGLIRRAQSSASPRLWVSAGRSVYGTVRFLAGGSVSPALCGLPRAEGTDPVGCVG